MSADKRKEAVSVDRSPLELFCESIDAKYPDASYMQLYYNVAKKVDKDYFTQLFLRDLQFRANHQRNFVGSIEGLQGCQPAGSKVLMASGEFKNIENVKIGDMVVSLQYNGNVTIEKVINTINWYCNDVYSVISNRNNKLLYKCSYNHLIPLTLDFSYNETGKTHKTRSQFYYKLNVLATPNEIKEWENKIKVCRWQTKQGLFISHFVDKKDCDIDPYFLGVFLGDGCFCNTCLSVSSANKKVIKVINNLVKPLRVIQKPNNKAKDYFYSINSLFGVQLKKLGLKNKKSGDKFIPKKALTSSSKYRLNILNGLIDTDGFVSKKGQIIITTKSKQLSEDIKFLVCSLGGNAVISKIKKKCQIKNFIGVYYNISVSLGVYKNLLNLNVDYKQKRLFVKNSWQKKGILNFKVRKTKAERVYGITITGDSQLYVTDNFMITHNCGKSLFGIALGIILGNIYREPFIIERDIFANPDELDYQLRQTGVRRRTRLYDEQPSHNVGLGSSSTQLSLKDYEEICRYTQNNLIYASPEVLDHAHYFIFRQVDNDPPRILNKKCKKCKDYNSCLKNFYSTLCDIPFYKRDGYPIKFNFMLETRRLADKLFVPRGIVSLPMVKPEYALRYDAIKDKNISKFEKYESESWRRMIKEIDEFTEKYQDKLIRKVDVKGRLRHKPESKEVIEGWFYDFFTTGRFTKGQTDIFVSMILQKLRHICETLNNS